jgi:hypothetical protein
MPIKLEDHLFSLEEKFWTQGAEYFRGNLASAAVMVFPDSAGVLVKDDVARRSGRRRAGRRSRLRSTASSS